jgi:hypothetical protein
MRASWINPGPKQPDLKLPQCSANRVTAYWRDVPGKKYRCQRPAVATIDGRDYCSQHGGAMALRNLIDG